MQSCCFLRLCDCTCVCDGCHFQSAKSHEESPKSVSTTSPRPSPQRKTVRSKENIRRFFIQVCVPYISAFPSISSTTLPHLNGHTHSLTSGCSLLQPQTAPVVPLAPPPPRTEPIGLHCRSRAHGSLTMMGEIPIEGVERREKIILCV